MQNIDQNHKICLFSLIFFSFFLPKSMIFNYFLFFIFQVNFYLFFNYTFVIFDQFFDEFQRFFYFEKLHVACQTLAKILYHVKLKVVWMVDGTKFELSFPSTTFYMFLSYLNIRPFLSVLQIRQKMISRVQPYQKRRPRVNHVTKRFDMTLRSSTHKRILNEN